MRLSKKWIKATGILVSLGFIGFSGTTAVNHWQHEEDVADATDELIKLNEKHDDDVFFPTTKEELELQEAFIRSVFAPRETILFPWENDGDLAVMLYALDTQITFDQADEKLLKVTKNRPVAFFEAYSPQIEIYCDFKDKTEKQKEMVYDLIIAMALKGYGNEKETLENAIAILNNDKKIKTTNNSGAIAKFIEIQHRKVGLD